MHENASEPLTTALSLSCNFFFLNLKKLRKDDLFNQIFGMTEFGAGMSWRQALSQINQSVARRKLEAKVVSRGFLSLCLWALPGFTARTESFYHKKDSRDRDRIDKVKQILKQISQAAEKRCQHGRVNTAEKHGRC